MAVDFNVMVGGEAGQGVQSVGAIITKTLANGGLNIFADQDYESRVRGGHNFFRVRVSDKDILALSRELDVLIALNKETIDIHKNEVKSDGIIIYDKDQTESSPRGKKYLNVPMVKIAEDTVNNKLMSNTVAAGAVFGLVGYDLEPLDEELENEFGRHGKDIVSDNIKAARAGYEYVQKQKASEWDRSMTASKGAVRKMLLHGNESLSFGAMAAGCKFYAGYPMTPASSIMEYLADKGGDRGVVMVHVEDEISALNMAVGAGFTGVRSLVATSGGGFALMVEALALAGMTETPVVIVLAQRPGPATGLPTRTEQGELLFALQAGHGEFPRAILAPATVEEAFHAAVKAFNLAEKYQTPVFILTDHHLATSYNTVEKFDLNKVKIDRGELLAGAALNKIEDYKRHAVTKSGISPRALPGQGKALVITDSDEHDEAGHMIEDGETRNQQNLKRLRKTESLKNEISPPRFEEVGKAEYTLIGWGSTYGAIREAASVLKREGSPVNILHLSELWPFPSESVIKALDNDTVKVIVEGNATAQLAQLIRRETGIKIEKRILKFDGRPLYPGEIVERLKKEVFK